MPMRTRFIFAVLSLVLLVPYSQHCLATEQERPKVALVTNGDVQSMAVSVGFLKALEEQNIVIDMVSGSYHASLVASLYALGYSATEIEKFILEIDWERVFSKGKFGLSLELLSFLSLHQEYPTFDLLPRPLRILTLDALSGNMVIIDSGNLATAILSSWSEPMGMTLFPPQQVSGRTLVGINSLPVSIPMELGADYVIAIDNELGIVEEDTSLFTIKSLFARRLILDEVNFLTYKDFYYRSDFSLVSDAAFPENIPSAITYGYKEAQRYNEAIKRYTTVQSPPQPTPMSRLKENQSYNLGNVKFEHSGQVMSEQTVSNLFMLQAGSQFTVKELQKSLLSLWETSNFQDISFSLKKQENNIDLRIKTIESKTEVDGTFIVQYGRKFLSNVTKHDSDEAVLVKVLEARVLNKLDMAIITALGEKGTLSAPYLDKMSLSYSNNFENVLTTVKAVNKISNAMVDEGKTEHISKLEDIYQFLSSYFVSSDSVFLIRPIQRNIDQLKNMAIEQSIAEFISQYKAQLYSLGAVSSALLLVTVLWSLLYWFAPIKLISIRNFMTSNEYTNIAKMLPLRYLSLIEFFVRRERVLDAWISYYAEPYKEYFNQQKTVNDRRVMIPIPVCVNGTNHASINSSQIEEAVLDSKSILWIWGEGGAGKTALACRIGNLLIDREKAKCLPILIEPGTIKDFKGGSIEELATSMLSSFLKFEKPINKDLFRWLLQNNKIAIIIDGFSELDTASVMLANPLTPNFNINALIVTSRKQPQLTIPLTEAIPMRVNGDQLSSFLDSYLTQINKRYTFTDTQFFKLCSQLSQIVGNKPFPVMLAKMFADLTVNKDSDSSYDYMKDQQPRNIGELMLAYINYLNRQTEGERYTDCEVQIASRIIAWECIKETFSPGFALRINVLTALADVNNANDLLHFLEKDLNIIRTIGVARDQYCFTLDPLAEYLASIHLLTKSSEKDIMSILENETSLINLKKSTEFQQTLLECEGFAAQDSKQLQALKMVIQERSVPDMFNLSE